MKRLVTALLSLLMYGCASNTVVVKVPLTPSEPGLLATVTVNDLRRPGTAASTRQAAFGTPMGNITFDPPEPQIIKNLLESELTKDLKEKGISNTQNYTCDIVEFGVNTNATVLYWDVVGRIRLILKHDSMEYSLSGTHTERTYIWPGESVIKKVVDESLKQISLELHKSLDQSNKIGGYYQGSPTTRKQPGTDRASPATSPP